MNSNVEFYTDGSCRNNRRSGSYGGWAVVKMIRSNYTESGFQLIDKWSEYEEETTNNRMELKALLKALSIIVKEANNNACYQATVFCDSAYCVNIFNSWIKTWARNNWKKAKGEPVENLDLIKELYNYASIDFPPFEVVKIDGHSGFIGNELADLLATNQQEEFAKFSKKCLSSSYLEKIF